MEAAVTPVQDVRRDGAKTARWWRLALVMVAVVGVVLRVTSLGDAHERTEDERVYTREAQMVEAHGHAGFLQLAAELRSNHALLSPTRAGYLTLLADTFRLTGSATPDAGACLSCAAGVLSVLGMMWICWRHLYGLAGVAALMLYALSPMQRMVVYRVWGEAVAELLAVVLLVLGLEIVLGDQSQRHEWIMTALFAGVAGLAPTLKETSVLGMTLIALSVVALLLWRRQWKKACTLTLLCVGAASVGIAWVAWCVDGFAAWRELSAIPTQFLAQNPYSLRYEQGSVLTVLHALWVLSPAMFVLLWVACAHLAVSLWRRRFAASEQFLLMLAAYVIAFNAAMLSLPHNLNLRFTISTVAPMCLLAGSGFAWMMEIASRGRAGRFVLPAALLAGAAWDEYNFEHRFVQGEVEDLAVHMIIADPYSAAEQQYEAQPLEGPK